MARVRTGWSVVTTPSCATTRQATATPSASLSLRSTPGTAPHFGASAGALNMMARRAAAPSPSASTLTSTTPSAFLTLESKEEWKLGRPLLLDHRASSIFAPSSFLIALLSRCFFVQHIYRFLFLLPNECTFIDRPTRGNGLLLDRAEYTHVGCRADTRTCSFSVFSFSR